MYSLKLAGIAADPASAVPGYILGGLSWARTVSVLHPLQILTESPNSTQCLSLSPLQWDWLVRCASSTASSSVHGC